jgi:FlaA1/EpsC-like NDP-sugar epimerase
VDDDSHKLGTTVHGIHVIGMTAQIPALIEQTGAKQAIITITNAPGSSIRRITEICKSVGIVPKIIPGVHELLDGKLNLSRLREVSVEDLLRRAPVELETPLVESFLTGKRVMVTGAGGSIGSELCRQVARFKPAVLLLVERSEFHLFSIHMELSNDHPNLMIKPLICDIADESRVSQVFQLHRPEVIFHAAAHKHVPMMELNPGEAIKNNSFGTKIVAQAADRYEADAFVLISTDKAVNPTSIMGATKRVAEMFIQALSQRSSTKFVAVRFGNVLGSTGSVIPIFKQQISKGGPVTITHPEMRRYFMTIPEASQLVMQAAAMGKGGEIFVLDMGEAVKIKDLAYDLIRMSGLEPERDIEVVYSGVRPGEKLFEELGFDSEKMNKTRHPQIYVGKLSQISWADMDQKLNELKPFCEIQQRAAVRAALGRVVPEMQDDAKTNDNHTAQAINSDAAQVINNNSPTLSTPNGVSIH